MLFRHLIGLHSLVNAWRLLETVGEPLKEERDEIIDCVIARVV